MSVHHGGFKLTQRDALGLVVAAVLLTAALWIWFGRVGPNRPVSSTAALSNAKQLAIRLHMYGADYDGRLPVAATWADATQPYVKSRAPYLDPKAPPDKPIFLFAFAAKLEGREIAEIESPSTVVMLFESNLNRWNQAGGRAEQAEPRRLGNSDVRGNIFAFADTAVKFVRETRQATYDGKIVWP